MKDKLIIEKGNPKLVNLEGGQRVYIGVPWAKRVYGTAYEIQIPNTPCVFTAERLQFNLTLPIFENVTVVLAHAGLRFESGQYYWQFQDNQQVGTVVEAFNLHSQTPIDIVIACSGSYADLHVSSDLISLGEVPELQLVNNLPNSSFIFGENIRVQSTMALGGDGVNLNVNCDLQKLKNREFLEKRKSSLSYREL